MNIKGFPTHTENPFEKTGIEERVITGGGHEKLVTDPETGEYYALKIVNRKATYNVDKRSFRKIYTDAIDKIKDLPQPGCRMFFYIIKHLDEKEDRIEINIEHAMQYCNYKNKGSYYLGVSQLIHANCLARSKYPNLFFINTDIFFNGDRTK